MRTSLPRDTRLSAAKIASGLLIAAILAGGSMMALAAAGRHEGGKKCGGGNKHRRQGLGGNPREDGGLGAQSSRELMFDASSSSESSSSSASAEGSGLLPRTCEQMAKSVGIKIVGGVEVRPPNRYPFVASLSRFGAEFCGASLIAPSVVVTAAHCSKLLTEVQIGRHNLDDQRETYERFKVADVASPPVPYDPRTNDNDIALLRLDGRSSFTPIAIDSSKAGPIIESVEDDALRVTTMGWGVTEYQGRRSGVLREVTVPGFTRDVCNAAAFYNGAITANMVCAAAIGQDSCQGDSGGPLIVSVEEQQRFVSMEGRRLEYGEDVLVGIVSWGTSCAALEPKPNGDGVQGGYPGVYVRLANYADWITATLRSWGEEPRLASIRAGSSPKPCGELPQTFKVMIAQPICATSRGADGQCMSGGAGYAWERARQACEVQGGRLCTKAELQQGQAKNTGCGLNLVYVWTSTPCQCYKFQGFVAALGGDGSEDDCFPADTTLDGNRCCGGA